MFTSDFHYDLPEEAIAQDAVEPRDAARLLDTRSMADHRFRDLPSLLRGGDLLVVNRSRVTAARLRGHKVGSGGAVELLILGRRDDGAWDALVRPARRVRAGTRVDVAGVVVTVAADPVDGVVPVSAADGGVEAAVAAAGVMPLPPYFHGRLDDAERYQTVYGDRPGSAAAPTAGLHFTQDLLGRLDASGIGLAAIDLRVGLDTFRPMAVDRVSDHRIHSEIVDVGPDAVDAIRRTRRAGGRVVAVGTTVVRALESAVDTGGEVAPLSGPTELFIVPGHRFQVVDLLVTNFHVPGSTLIVLVAAFMGHRWRAAYDSALERGYRFLSFGDSMLAERAES